MNELMACRCPETGGVCELVCKRTCARMLHTVSVMAPDEEPLSYGADPQADAQYGEQCADTDGLTAAEMRIAALSRELADMWRVTRRLSATWEHLPDVAAPLPRDHTPLFRAIGKHR